MERDGYRTAKAKTNAGALHCATHDKTVNGSGRDDAVFGRSNRRSFQVGVEGQSVEGLISRVGSLLGILRRGFSGSFNLVIDRSAD
jgi:hypothetical protein